MTVSTCAVVIAFRRLTLLQECINALRIQTRPLQQVIVIDQGGISEIGAWLANQPDLLVISQPNLGTAGGFCKGLEVAFSLGHEWVWLFDDDGIAWPDALAHLLNTPRATGSDTVFLCSNTLTVSGDVQQASIPEPPPTWYGSVLDDHCVRVSRAAWLGLLVHRRGVQRAGLPVPEFFIWHDDQEFTERLSSDMKAYCVLSSRITHKQSPEALDPFTPAGYFKIKHGLRNQFGWLRLRPMGSLRRWRKMAIYTVRCMIDVISRRLPAKAFLWIFKGWFFRPRVPRSSCCGGTVADRS
jgi:rhamnopyranosyl-N-acetylglucosaminyl-diphospho-decaprenol beta-1,3/1,4-galactofuranosyltransferase